MKTGRKLIRFIGCCTCCVLFACGPTGKKDAAGTRDVLEAAPDTFHVQEDEIAYLYPLTNDALGFTPDNVEVELFEEPVSGVLAVSDATTVTYTPNEDFFTYKPSMVDTIKYKISETLEDGTVRDSIGSVTIVVVGINDPSVAKDDVAQTPEDTAIEIDVLANDEDVDFDIEQGKVRVWQYSVTGSAGGTVEIKGDLLVYTPPEEFVGTETFSYTLTDGTAESEKGTVFVNVHDVNDAPRAVGASFNMLEDKALVGTLLVEDPDDDAILFTTTLAPGYGALSITDTTKTFVYTPNLNYEGEDGFEFKASDGLDDSNVVRVVILIAPVNDPPLANDQGTSVSENTTLVGTLTATDVDSTSVTYTVVDAPFNGAVTTNGEKFYYTPNTNFAGLDSFTFNAFDGELTSNTATVTINVINVNEAPMVAAASATGPEDAVLSGSISFFDNDGDLLSFEVVSAPTSGTATVANIIGSFSYIPNRDFSGTDSFTVRANDGSLHSNVVTVEVNILAINDAPFATGDSVVLEEDNVLVYQVKAFDPDNTVLTYYITRQAFFGTVTVTDATTGWVRYTPTTNYVGNDSFEYGVSDGTVIGVDAQVDIAITPINDRPTAVTDTVQLDEDTVYIGYLWGEDVDEDGLAYTMFTNVTAGTLYVDPITGWVKYTPPADFNGVEWMEFLVDDGILASDKAKLFFDVQAVNDPPFAADVSTSTNEDTLLAYTLPLNDPDGDAVTYQLWTAPSSGTAAINNGKLYFQPAADWVGVESMQYRVDDGDMLSDVADVIVTVIEQNDLAQAYSEELTIEEDLLARIDLNAYDPESDSLTCVQVAAPTNGTLEAFDTAACFVDYRPDPEFNGTDYVQWRVLDSTGLSSVATLTINVSYVNDNPVVTDKVYNVAEEGTLNGSFTASDPDGEDVSVIVENGPSHAASFSYDVSLHTFSYVPEENYNGTDVIYFTGNDGSLVSRVGKVEITVTAVNDRPEGVAQAYTIDEDAVLSAQLDYVEGEGDAVSFAKSGDPVSGAVSINPVDGSFTYTPDANANGTDSFGYTVDDGDLTSAVSTVTITITPVNDAPYGTTEALAVTEDTAAIAAFGAMDVEGDSLTYIITKQPAKGSVVDNANGTYTYTPAANQTGADTFRYIAFDGDKNSALIDVNITISNENDAPIVQNLSFETLEDEALVDGLFADDPEGDTLTFNVVANPVSGTISTFNASSGVFEYTPDADANGVDTFTYRVYDGNLFSDTVTVTVTVIPQNDRPLASNQALSVTEDASWVGKIAATDADGDSLQYIEVNSTLKGALSLNTNTGDYTYTPPADYVGSDTFKVLVFDGTSNSDVATYSITVTAMNDAPRADASSWETNEDEQLVVVLPVSDPDNAGAVVVNSIAGPVSGAVGYVNSGGTITMTYTPTANATGTDSWTIQANDTIGLSPITTVTVTILAQNDAPSISNASKVIDEDTAVFETVAITDPDAGDTHVLRAVRAPANGTLVVTGATNQYVYTPDADWSGTDTFEIEVRDSNSAYSNAATITVTVNPVNDLPVAEPMVVTTLEDITLADSFVVSDADGDGLTAVLVTAATSGTATTTGGIGYSYEPNASFNGTDTFWYRVVDGSGSSNTTSVTVHVGATNDRPEAVNATYILVEDSSYAGSLTATDPELNALAYEVKKMPAHGTLTVTYPSNSFWYVPDPDYVGNDTILFTARETTTTPDLETGIGQVTFTMTGVNDAPKTNDMSINTHEDVPVVSVLDAYDVEGDSLNFYIAGGDGPSNGTLVIDDLTNGAFTFTPDADFDGTDSFVFSVDDGPQTATGTVIVTIIPRNDAPTVSNTAIDLNEDQVTDITLTATDPDNGIGFYEIAVNPVYGTLQTLNAATGDFRYTPKADWFGTDTFQFVAEDVSGMKSVVATVTLNVASQDDYPTANTMNITAGEDADYIATFDATDPDPGSSMTFVIDSYPTWGTVEVVNTNQFKFRGAADQTTADSFTYVAIDNTSRASAIVPVNISFVATNDAPRPQPRTIYTDEDVAITNLTLDGNDPDSGSTSWVLVSTPRHGSLNPVDFGNGTVNYTPDPDWNGTDYVVYRVDDGDKISGQATLTIVVNPVNDTPVAVADSHTVREDTLLVSKMDGYDADGNGVSYIIKNDDLFDGTVTTAHGNIDYDPANGLFTYTPDANYNNFFGGDSFEFRVSDGTEFSGWVTVDIDVTPANDRPVAFNQSVTVEEDGSIEITLTGSDIDMPEGDTISFRPFIYPNSGTFSTFTLEGTVRYYPDPNYNGVDSFTFQVVDEGRPILEGNLGSNIATISINVTPVNDVPVFNVFHYDGYEDLFLDAFLDADDIDAGDTVTYAVFDVDGADEILPVTFVSLTGQFNHLPVTNFNGELTMAVKACDQGLAPPGQLCSPLTWISMYFENVNDAPVLTGANYNLSEEGTMLVDLWPLASDVDGDVLDIVQVGNFSDPTPAGVWPEAFGASSVNITADTDTGKSRWLTVTGGLNRYGTLTIPIRAEDAEDNSQVQMISVAISNTPDKPVITHVNGMAAGGTLSLNLGSENMTPVETTHKYYVRAYDPDGPVNLGVSMSSIRSAAGFKSAGVQTTGGKKYIKLKKKSYRSGDDTSWNIQVCDNTSRCVTQSMSTEIQGVDNIPYAKNPHQTSGNYEGDIVTFQFRLRDEDNYDSGAEAAEQAFRTKTTTLGDFSCTVAKVTSGGKDITTDPTIDSNLVNIVDESRPGSDIQCDVRIHMDSDGWITKLNRKARDVNTHMFVDVDFNTERQDGTPQTTRDDFYVSYENLYDKPQCINPDGNTFSDFFDVDTTDENGRVYDNLTRFTYNPDGVPMGYLFVSHDDDEACGAGNSKCYHGSYGENLFWFSYTGVWVEHDGFMRLHMFDKDLVSGQADFPGVGDYDTCHFIFTESQ